MDHYLRTEGLGYGFGGRTIRVSNNQFWMLSLQGRIGLSLGETIRRRLWNKAVEQYESQRHPGADAACVSFDDT